MNPVPTNIVWFYGQDTDDLQRIREWGIGTVSGMPENGFED